MTVLPLVIIEESFSIYQHRYNYISLLTLYQVIQSNRHRHLRLSHVENLVLYVFHIEPALLHRLQLLDDRPEEHVDDEGVDGPLVVDVQNPPEVLDSFGSLLVIHRQHELQEPLVVHLPVDGRILLEDPVDHDRRESL